MRSSLNQRKNSTGIASRNAITNGTYGGIPKSKNILAYGKQSSKFKRVNIKAGQSSSATAPIYSVNANENAYQL